MRSETARSFEVMADAIMYRWSVERDTWVSSTEVAEARTYLERVGLGVTELPDGRFRVQGESEDPLGASRLVLIGLRHLHASRRSRAQP